MCSPAATQQPASGTTLDHDHANPEELGWIMVHHRAVSKDESCRALQAPGLALLCVWVMVMWALHRVPGRQRCVSEAAAAPRSHNGGAWVLVHLSCVLALNGYLC